jgi:D-3-phosphoglycerate dehydrogenase
MSVGRASNKPGGSAIGVLNLDSVPSDEAIKDLKAIGNVIDKVQTITLPERGELPHWLQG